MTDNLKLMSAILVAGALTAGVPTTCNAQTTKNTPVQAPVSNITGQVLDEKGETMPGARVTIKMKNGLESHSITDNDGNFSFAVSGQEERVYASFIGYKESQAYIKSGKNNYILRLKPDDNMLEEVVATGYNTIDKRKLTSSITSITAKDLDFKGALSVDQMLEGKIPGLMVLNTSTTPGAKATMRLRGTSTFTGSREPLWVIDGVIYENPVPVSADDINSLDNINLIGNAISGLNPQDIERIDVLKDASATAIYGTRAANGVIVVTTKTGEAGKTHVNYSFNAAVQSRPGYSDFNLMTSKQRIDVSREIMQKGLYFESMPERYGYEGAMMDYWDKKISFQEFQNQVSRMEATNTDWFGELYRTSFSQVHNVSLSGGTSSTRYYASVGYDNDKGTERGTALERFTARMNLTTHVSDRITLDLRLSASTQEGKYNSSFYSAFDEAYYTNRIFPARDENGEISYINKLIKTDQTTQQKVYGQYNILNEYANSGQSVKNNSLNLTANLNWEIMNGLRYTTTVSMTSTSNTTENWIGEDTYYCSVLRGYGLNTEHVRDDVQNESSLMDGGIWSSSNTLQRAYLWRNQLNYHFDINDLHHLNFDLGHEVTSTQYRGHSTGQVPGYMPQQGETFGHIWASDATDAAKYYWYLRHWFMAGESNPRAFPVITDKKDNKLSFFITATYTYKNLVSFNINARNDGSNKFGQYESAKFNPVWSMSGRFNFTELPSFKNLKWIDQLAMRASYGYRGSVPSATPYLIINTPRKSSVSGELAAGINQYPNANLKWEKTSTYNVGIDASFLNSRLSAGIDFYHSRSTDLISNRSVSLINGTTSLAYNDGEATNTGIEISLNGLIIKTNDFRWRASVNYSYNKNKIKHGAQLANGNSYVDYINGSVILDNSSVDGFYSYKFAGLDANGLPTFSSLTGNPGGLTKDQFMQRILTYSGTRTPNSYGGFSTEFAWKGITLRAQFTYKLAYKQRLLALYQNGNPALPQPQDNMNADFVNRWRKPGDEAFTNIPALTNASLNYNSQGNMTGKADTYIDVDQAYASYCGPQSYTGWYMYDNSDARVVDASHIRFRSLTIGYDLPANWLHTIGISNCRIDFQAQNLGVWAFDKKLKGQDPDQVASIGMPVLPTFNFGVQIGF